MSRSFLRTSGISRVQARSEFPEASSMAIPTAFHSGVGDLEVGVVRVRNPYCFGVSTRQYSPSLSSLLGLSGLSGFIASDGTTASP